MKTINCINLILLFLCFFIIFQCSENTSEPEMERPDSIKIVPKSSNDRENEKGIDAVAEGDGIFMEWYTPQDSRIKWIKIYRRAQYKEDFQFLSSVSNEDTSYIDYNVSLEMRYYYFLKSVDRNKVESEPSDTISYMLYPKPTGLSNTNQTMPLLSWEYSAIPPVGYMLRLIDKQSSEMIWLSSLIESYDPVVQIPFNVDGKSKSDSLLSNHSYQWRVDVVGSNLYSGSESNWKLLEVE